MRFTYSIRMSSPVTTMRLSPKLCLRSWTGVEFWSPAKSRVRLIPRLLDIAFWDDSELAVPVLGATFVAPMVAEWYLAGGGSCFSEAILPRDTLGFVVR